VKKVGNSRKKVDRRLSQVGFKQMRKLTRPWTDEDDALLLRLAASGASAMRASVALKKNKKHLKARARKLGTPFVVTRRRRKLQARAETSSFAALPSNK
jgi:hypothetical protein